LKVRRGMTSLVICYFLIRFMIFVL